MPTYTVVLEREVIEEGYIQIEAASEEEARVKGEEASASDIRWDVVDKGRGWAMSAELEE